MIIRREEFLVTLLGLALVGCGSKVKKEPEEDEDEDDKKKKKKKRKKKSENESSDKEAKKEDDKPKEPKKEDKPAQAGGSGPDLGPILGTKADGFAPLVFAKLKEDTLPADTRKVFPDIEAPNEFGFAPIKKGLPSGVAFYELSFLEGKLKFASIVFTKAVSDEAFWNKLVAHLKAKLAPVEMSDMTKGTDKHAMFIGPSFHSITIGTKISLEELGYEIQYAVM